MIGSEDLLQFVWKHRLFSQHNLLSLGGKKVLIDRVGLHNHHAGPDFEDAHLLLDDLKWHGSVEIHIRSSDWNAHRHQFDEKYNNVILHVVWEYDSEIRREDGTVPDTLLIKPYISANILPKYRRMMENQYWIPCQNAVSGVDPFYINHWLSGVLVERLMDKTTDIYKLLEQYSGNWEEVTYLVAARSFGFKTNSEAFEMLAKSLPLAILLKNQDKRFLFEALFFGQSGLLKTTKSDEQYVTSLKEEYAYLRKAYSLKPLNAHVWKFLRMRPMGFPSMRIAQFSAFCFSSKHLFSRIIETEDLTLYTKWLSDLPVNDYWKNHYHFNDAKERLHGNQLGRQAINSILLNTIVTVLFAYGKYIGNESHVKRAISLLQTIPVEHNSIVKRYEDIGFKCRSAADSQALLHLKAHYCDLKRCLDCEIGFQIMKKE